MPRFTTILLLLIALFLPPRQVAAAYTPQTVLQATNQARQTFSIPSLKEAPLLDLAAQNAAKDLASKQLFTHQGMQSYVEATKYRYSYLGQNLARGFTDTSSTVTAWMNSPTHRANLLSKNYTETGFGMASSPSGEIYVVQYFAHPSNGK